MDLATLLRTLLRRWYLFLTVLALTFAAGYFVVREVGPTYEASGSVLMFPPTETAKVKGELQLLGNPFLELDGLGQARDILIRSITSKSSRDALAEEFPLAEFEATPDFTNGSPIVLFTVESSDREQTMGALANLIDSVPDRLAGFQEGLELRQGGQITSVELTHDKTPDVVHKDQIRAAVAVGGVTFALGLLGIALLDSLLRSRAARKREESAGEQKNEDSDGSVDAPHNDPSVFSAKEKTSARERKQSEKRERPPGAKRPDDRRPGERPRVVRAR